LPSFGAGSFYFSEKGGLCRAFSTPKSPGRFTSGLKRHRCAVPETGGGFGRDGMKGYRCAVRHNSPPDCYGSPSCVFSYASDLGAPPQSPHAFEKA